MVFPELSVHSELKSQQTRRGEEGERLRKRENKEGREEGALIIHSFGAGSTNRSPNDNRGSISQQKPISPMTPILPSLTQCLQNLVSFQRELGNFLEVYRQKRQNAPPVKGPAKQSQRKCSEDSINAM